MKESATSLVSDGLAEHGVLFTPNEPNGSAIIFTHGYGTSSGHYKEFAEPCANNGAICLTLDLLSHGKSEGIREDLTISDYLGGLVVAYDFLASLPQVDETRIGTVAGSFGAYITVLLSEERNLESLLLRVPALYPDRLRDLPRSHFDTDAVLRTEPDRDNSALRAIRNFPRKILLVSSGKDEIIMPSTISAYSDALNNGKHIEMKYASHSLDEKSTKVFKEIIVDWAAEL